MSTTHTSARRALREAQLSLAHALTVYGPQDEYTRRVAALVKILHSIISARKALR